jgi:hypothetical protein
VSRKSPVRASKPSIFLQLWPYSQL